MANEITKVELFGENRDGNPISYTIASSAVVPKGTLMNITDPRTTAANVASGAYTAGVASEQHDGLDFSTKVSVWTQGVFEAYASGAITAGDEVQAASVVTTFPNYIGTLQTGGIKIGYALETAATGEQVTFRLNL
jgi:uncharacterized protein DUF2190